MKALAYLFMKYANGIIITSPILGRNFNPPAMQLLLNSTDEEAILAINHCQHFLHLSQGLGMGHCWKQKTEAAQTNCL